MQYVPLWLDIIDGPCWKLLDLPPEVFRFYTLCLLVAQKFDFVEGFLPDERTLAAWIHMDRDEVVTLRDMAVTCHVLERTDDGQYKIHDWEHWRDSKDPTAAIRKRKERAKKKALASKDEPESRNGHADVTATSHDVTPQHSTNSIQHTTLNSHTPLPPEAGESECACEPFGSDENPEILPLIVVEWTSEERRVIDRSTQRWGSSNGDVVVGDLLRDYPAGLVAEACDAHFSKVKQALHPGRLRGLCRTIFDEGRWRPSANRASSDPGPTNMPVSAHNPPADLDDYGKDFEKHLAMLRAKGQVS